MARHFYFDGKSISPWDVDNPVGWTILGGQQEKGIDHLIQRVPWLYRGIKDRSNNVSHMPWLVEQGENEIVNNANWNSSKSMQMKKILSSIRRALKKQRPTKSIPNELLFLTNPRRLLSQLEQSLCVAGRAYMALEINKGGYIRNIKYIAPTTITEIYNTKREVDKWYDQEYQPGDLMGYERSVNGQKFDCTRADKPPVIGKVQIVALYDPDYSAEIGPGIMSDATAALTAAGVLYSYDTFCSNYFERGAIKASILTVDGATQQEQERLQHWWDDVVAGVKNAFSAVVLRGKAVTPVVIGEGLEAMADQELSTSRRQDIATALGVPESRMWSAAANYATRKEDELAYFRGTILPECDIIAEAFNEQVFTAFHKLDGYRWEFTPEDLDVFQEDETQRAASLSQLTAAGVPLLLAMDILGYDLTDVQRAELEPKPEPEPQPIPPQLVPFAGQDNQPAEQPAPPDEAPPMGVDQMASIRAMLKNWQRKALHAYKLTGKADIEWTTTLLPASQVEGIRESLAACSSGEQVKAVFDGVDIQPVTEEESDILKLAREIRLAREALSA